MYISGSVYSDSGFAAINYTVRPTNTSVLYCIKYQPTYFLTEAHTYSYEEHRVGTWVDGKPLYEKTVNFGSLPNATTKEVPHGIENVSVIWVYDGFVFGEADSTPVSLPSTFGIASNWSVSVDVDAITFFTGMDRTSKNAIVTLRYTKTTD